ncbi:MAG: hypothetical protein HOP12_10685 [Candidatus Eisenbacteria bacterium]|uniref:Heat-inducible transcription repressor HrcA n=1 Tax=Eiseniibacteriota bacterium TaxID=2212470 RepID=A0A849SZV8_UNCEI|nr:hypothetical protein [Candidatus Eisenbacteria bacterium]
MSQPVIPGGARRGDLELTQRQREVFVAVVAQHGRTTRPVGSDSLAAQGVRGSSAAIRSALAELEELGLLARVHASSGRVPSSAGYAHYVCHEVTPAPLGDEALRRIDERLRRSARDVEQLLEEASRVLATLTQQLGLAASAPLERERVESLELAPLDPERCMLVFGLRGGTVRTLQLEFESPLDHAALEEVERTLRGSLLRLTLSEVRERLEESPALVRDSAMRIVTRALRARLGAPELARFHSSGAGWIASEPEWSAARELGPLMRIVEEGPPLDRLLVTPLAGQAAVRIALDEDRALTGLSLVTFPLAGSNPVAIGVLGPLRMDYARALAAVEAVGSRVAGYL